MSDRSSAEATSSGPAAPKRGRRTAPAAAEAPAPAASDSSDAPVKIGGHRYSFKDKQMIDYIRTSTRSNVWYYRDRASVPRGPCSLPVLREAWVQGVIDENTMVWGQGLMDWLPVKNVRTLVPQIRTVEVQVATWIKRTFALKPALENIRKERAQQRTGAIKTTQVEDMY